VTYQVVLDGTTAYDSGLVTGSSPTVRLDLDVSGANELRLVSTDGGDGRRYDWADWGAAHITCKA
jgi:NPCBM/NEW2 domain